MRSRDLSSWMGDALSLLEQAERMRRQFCRAALGEAHGWEPPVDVVESEDALIVHVALPGVPAAGVTIAVDANGVTVSGQRRFPAAQATRIHRIEIPYGRFERHITLPMHALDAGTPAMADGCLVLTFRKRKDTA